VRIGDLSLVQNSTKHPQCASEVRGENSCEIESLKVRNKPPLAQVTFRGFFGPNHWTNFDRKKPTPAGGFPIYCSLIKNLEEDPPRSTWGRAASGGAPEPLRVTRNQPQFIWTWLSPTINFFSLLSFSSQSQAGSTRKNSENVDFAKGNGPYGLWLIASGARRVRV